MATTNLAAMLARMLDSDLMRDASAWGTTDDMTLYRPAGIVQQMLATPEGQALDALVDAAIFRVECQYGSIPSPAYILREAVEQWRQLGGT